MVGIKKKIWRSTNQAVFETDLNTGRILKKAYASYIAQGEKTALIGGAADGVRSDIIKNADYAVFTHSLPPLGINRILDLNPDIEIVATVAAMRNLKEITNRGFNELIAKDGAELDLGGRTLKFIIAPHLNHPDSMLVYDTKDKLLFSGLAFGSYESGGIKSFYKNELSRFKPFVKTAAQRVKELDIDVICPEVGSFIAKNPHSAIDKYILWSSPSEDDKKSAAIFYVSSSGNTAAMAKIIEQTMLDYDIRVKRFDILKSVKKEMLEALYGSDMLIFGTPTIYQNAAKPIWDLISCTDLVNMRRKPCMVFGSYGWGGEGAELLCNHLKLLHISPFDKPFKCVFTPSAEDISELTKYTERFIKNEI